MRMLGVRPVFLATKQHLHNSYWNGEKYDVWGGGGGLGGGVAVLKTGKKRKTERCGKGKGEATDV